MPGASQGALTHTCEYAGIARDWVTGRSASAVMYVILRRGGRYSAVPLAIGFGFGDGVVTALVGLMFSPATVSTSATVG